MIHLLKIEFSKVRNYRTFWVILMVYMVLVPLAFIGIGNLPLPFLPEKSEMFGFPSVWNYITWSASWFNVLLGVLVVTLTCNEITFRTQRQNIIDGMSRSQMILSKFYFFAVLAAAVTFYTFLIGLIFGICYTGFNDIFSGIDYIAIYFVQTLGYFAFAFFFAVLIKRAALSIVLYIVIILLRSLYSLALGPTLAQFFPINVIGDLTPFPFFKEILEFAAKQDPNFEEPFIISQTLRSSLALIYTAIFTYIGYFVVKRRDL